MNLSFSSLELLHTCPRKFELNKLCAPDGAGEGESLDLIAGKATHSGIQALLAGKSLEHAVWEAYQEYSIRPNVDILERNKKKSFPLVVQHIIKFDMSAPLSEWRLAKIKNHWGETKDAIELGFRIELPNGHFYRGFIDAILENADGEFAALEIKTSGFENANEALWQNSFQGMSYALIADLVTQKRNPQQLFLILEFPKLGQQVMRFWRSREDKLSWLPSLALDVNMLETYKKNRFFPMRGGSCFQYYRTCPHLGVCNLTRPEYTTEEKLEKPEDYDFNFTLDTLLNFAKG